MCKFNINVDSFKRALGLESPAEETAKATEEALKKAAAPTPEASVEEWVWVTGYKGMDQNMQCCNNFQYEIGKRYDMPEDAEVAACSSGFHMCLNMDDVFGYVSLGSGNRFFEVRALVRKGDKEKYGTHMVVKNGQIYYDNRIDKLVAKSIEIVRELTIDEILENTEAKDWSSEYKQMTITIGVDGVKSIMRRDELVGYGYSTPFAQWLVDNKKYEVAKAVGSQTDLSMDMKCLMILNG